ncbi:hypothetical protein AB0N17_03650 [Streptomyces sp. NPDC051133]|uniref:hypothetical protein n=1 Tax=Streptomyces sp. NPDC051133 TaxID=3155521 RepID=UPI003428981F
MALTDKDPHNISEIARTVALGYRIVRRQQKGKGTARLEKRVEAIREKAQAREDNRGKGRQ